MAVIVCCSATGSPGATTTSLGLALCWPRDVLLADCDREPSQTVQVGYLRGYDVGGRGLGALARSHREGGNLRTEVWHQAVPLSQTDEFKRRFLPGFSHARAPGLFTAVWPDLVSAFSSLDRTGIDVVVDAGRVGRDGLPTPVVVEADVILVCVRSSLRSLAGLRLHLPGLLDQVASHPGHAAVGLALIGEGHPYTASEITAQFQCPVWVTIAHDPAVAAVLSDGEPPGRKFAESHLNRSFRAATSRLSQRIDQTRQVLDAPRRVNEAAAS